MKHDEGDHPMDDVQSHKGVGQVEESRDVQHSPAEEDQEDVEDSSRDKAGRVVSWSLTWAPGRSSTPRSCSPGPCRWSPR